MLDNAYQPLYVSADQRYRFSRLQSLREVSQLSPDDFVDYCGTLFEADGHTVYLPTSMADPEVDLLLVRGHDVLIVQCDHSPSQTADLSFIQQLHETALRNDGSRGIFITTGKISEEAILWAAGYPIDLLDGQAFAGWMNFIDVAESGFEETLVDGRPVSRSVSSEKTTPYTPVKKSKTTRPMVKSAPVKKTESNRDLKRWLSILAIVLASVLVLSWLSFKMFSGRTEKTDVSVLTPPTREVNAEGIAPTLISEPKSEQDEVAEDELVMNETKTPVPLKAELLADFELPPVTVTTFDTNQSSYVGLLPISLGHRVETMDIWDGTEDLTATWQLGYDANYLYGYITVQDETIIQRYPPATAYIDDSLEIEIDTLHDQAETGQPDDFQYIISPGDFNGRPAGIFRYNGTNGAMKESYGTRAEVNSAKTSDGYVVAIRIPWADIDMSEPEAGTKIGMTLIVNDKDLLVENSQEVIYSNVVTRKWNKPFTWGTITLGE